MNKKGILYTSLSALILVAAVTASAWAQEKKSTSESSVVASPTSTNSNEGNEITPLTVDKTWEDSVSEGSVKKNTFSINAGFGQLKLSLMNLSSRPVKVTLTHDHTGLVYFAKTIDGDSSADWINFNEGYPQGMRTGIYTLQWIGGGYNVNGQVIGKLGSSMNDF